MSTFAELLVRIGGDATGFTSAMDGVASKATAVVGQTEQKLTGLAGVFSGLGGKVAAGLGFAALGASVISAAEKFEQAGFTLRRATGATGADLAALEKSFTNLYTTSARSAEEISGALAGIKVETKLSGAALEDLAKANLAFAKVTGTDVKSAIEGTQQVFKNWSIAARDQAAALDILYKVIQETKIKVGDLTGAMATAGPILRTLGFSFKETAALIGNMEEQGVEAEKTISALTMGFRKLAKESADPKKALLDLIERMSAIKDKTEAAALASPIFGRAAITLADAVGKGAFKIGELTAALDKNKDSLKAAEAETESMRNVVIKFQHQLESTISAHKEVITTVGAGSMAWLAFGDSIKAVGGLLAKVVVTPAGLFGAAVIASIYATSKAIDELNAKYDSYFKRLEGKKDYLPGQKPEEQFTVFQGQDVSSGLAVKYIADTTSAVESYEVAIKRLKEEQKRLNEVAADAKAKYEAVARAYNSGNTSAGQLSAALDVLTKAQRAADPGKWIEQQEKANSSFQKWAATLEQKMLDAEGNITKARLEWLAFSDALVRDEPVDAIEAIGYAVAHLPFPVLSEQLQGMANSASLLGGQMEHLSKIKWPDSIKSLSTQTEQAIEDEKLLGIEGEKTADKLRAAYERLESEGLLNDRTRLQSKRNILAQEIKEAEAAGRKVTEAQRKQLEEYEKILAGHGNKIKSFWRDLGKEIEGIARNWAQDIGHGLWDTLLGKNRRAFNQGLDDQTADLQASLAERSTEWTAYQADIEAGYSDARQKYQDTLAEGEADLAASLAERTKEYADAEADNAAALVAVREEYAKELAGTLADLASSLEERRVEYEGYVADINAKLTETRQAHADQLSEQLRDLENSLDDQRRSYSEYVDDVNKKLSRVGEDYAESIDDETKSVKAGVDDKKQEYKRDEQDILERIKRLKAAGKTEQDDEIKDLRLSLSRKQEDLDEYIREAGEKLAEFTSDAKRQNDREVADLKESLTERTDEWTRFQAENATKRNEAIDKNAKDLAKDEADLAKSLATRTADWTKYQADNAAKVEEANSKYTEGLAKEEADLAASLAKKKQALDDYVAEANAKWEKIQAAALAALTKEEADLAASLAKRQSEYDAYVADTQTKLDALVAAHRTAWDDIGSMMVGAFERAGESLAMFVTDKLMGSLLNSIKKGGSLWGAFEELGKKIVDIFTGAGNAVSNIPTLPGQIPGGSTTVSNPPIPGAPAPTEGPGAVPNAGTDYPGLISSGLQAFKVGWDIVSGIKWGSVEMNTHFTALNLKTIFEKFRPELITAAANSFVTASTLAAMRNDFQTGAYKIGTGDLNYTTVLDDIKGILDNIRSLVSQIREGAGGFVGGGTLVSPTSPNTPMTPGRNIQAELDAAKRDLEASRIGANIAASSKAFADELEKLLAGPASQEELQRLADLAGSLRESGVLSVEQFVSLMDAIVSDMQGLDRTEEWTKIVTTLSGQLRETGNTFEDWAKKVEENSAAVDRLTAELAGGIKVTPPAPTITAPSTGASSTVMPSTSLVGSLFNLSAVMAHKPSEQYGNADWLRQMLSMQQGTLANVTAGIDPNNPTGRKDWAAAYSANTGPAYQAWLTGAAANTKGMLDKFTEWTAAVMAAAAAVTASAGRAIVVNLEGGSARDQEFADMVITRYTRQLKAGGLL